jgi:hypothetical protein
MDPPEYYDRPGGFLVYHHDVPEELLALNALHDQDNFTLASTVPHFRLINYQLLQARSRAASQPDRQAGRLQTDGKTDRQTGRGMDGSTHMRAFAHTHGTRAPKSG